VDLLRRYQNLGPFTIDELVSAVNSVLRDRPDLAVTKRTIRFYVAQGIIPPPRGAPKFARYPFENLLTIVAIRRMQDRGEKLEVAQKRAVQVRMSDPEEAIRWVESLGKGESPQVREQQAVYSVPPPSSAMAPPSVPPLQDSHRLLRESAPSRSWRTTPLERYELGPDITLTVPADRDQERVLNEAREAITEILRDFHDTT
jgi:DNA-binding transcriptional MerR regulator